ncbi:hypothetical protein [Micromonospora sp. LOL_023]|uniref:hypothetical protein n=1 Tax=Micromonospora sp. LOL_023 TaxID=3345418 RepID=UPI003A88623A
MTGAGIWGLLLASCFVLLALLALAALSVRSSQDHLDSGVPGADADELEAEAEAIAAAAADARTAADLARDRAAAADQARDAAWQRQETAGRAYHRAVRVARRSRPAPAPAPVLPAQHERDVSRAALTAYRRGDLTVQQLREVWRRAGDPNPKHDEVDRAVDQHRMRDRAARREYDAFAAVARRAGETARIAETAAEALAQEAAAAGVDAAEARYAADRYQRRR